LRGNKGGGGEKRPYNVSGRERRKMVFELYSERASQKKRPVSEKKWLRHRTTQRGKRRTGTDRWQKGELSVELG